MVEDQTLMSNDSVLDDPYAWYTDTDDDEDVGMHKTVRKLLDGTMSPSKLSSRDYRRLANWQWGERGRRAVDPVSGTRLFRYAVDPTCDAEDQYELNQLLSKYEDPDPGYVEYDDSEYLSRDSRTELFFLSGECDEDFTSSHPDVQAYFNTNKPHLGDFGLSISVDLKGEGILKTIIGNSRPRYLPQARNRVVGKTIAQILVEVIGLSEDHVKCLPPEWLHDPVLDVIGAFMKSGNDIDMEVVTAQHQCCILFSTS